MKKLISEKNLFGTLYNAQYEGVLEQKYIDILASVFAQYRDITKERLGQEELFAVFNDLFTQVVELQRRHVIFYFYHERVLRPFNYYKFGLDFCRPIVDFAHSTLQSHDVLDRMLAQLANGENIILLANHQAEIDPQIIELMLQHHGYQFGSDIIFVAGERVLKDPLAIPFSLGRNIISIYSKRYQDIDPALKVVHQKHNRQAMQKMAHIMEEGSKIIFVAPSGGRDRKKDGILLPEVLDEKSVQLFRVIGRNCSKKSHFYPLAIHTYDTLPPPANINVELGEERHISCSPVHINFGASFEGDDWTTQAVHDRIVALYKTFPI